jgi:ferredoxin--NADP+ reductase
MEEPRRVAIVGAGPSGIFAAQSLLAHPGIAVDLYDRLPTPYGLLRYGVAPDHTSIKGVGEALARVFESPDGPVPGAGRVRQGRDAQGAARRVRRGHLRRRCRGGRGDGRAG